MIRFSVFFACFFTVVLCEGDFMSPGFNAAACCARGIECFERNAKLSESCTLGKWMVQQPKKCQELACDFCIGRKNRTVCNLFPILKNCFKQGPPYPSPPKFWKILGGTDNNKDSSAIPSPSSTPNALVSGLPSPIAPNGPQISRSHNPRASQSSLPDPLPSRQTKPRDSHRPKPSPSRRPKPSKSLRPKPSKSRRPRLSPSRRPKPSKSRRPKPSRSHLPKPSSKPPKPRKGCSHHARNGVVKISAANFPIWGQWSRTSDGAVIWKKRGGGGIDKPKRGNPFCVRFTADRNGRYLFTVVSSAPAFTEHNDAWFKFPAPVRTVLYRPSSGSIIKSVSGWLKGFQNDGKNLRSNYILNIDRNGHQIFMEGLHKGSIYRVCVAGRSSRFKIYNIVLVHCKYLKSCNVWQSPMRDRLRRLPRPAKCK